MKELLTILDPSTLTDRPLLAERTGSLLLLLLDTTSGPKLEPRRPIDSNRDEGGDGNEYEAA